MTRSFRVTIFEKACSTNFLMYQELTHNLPVSVAYDDTESTTLSTKCQPISFFLSLW